MLCVYCWIAIDTGERVEDALYKAVGALFNRLITWFEEAHTQQLTEPAGMRDDAYPSRFKELCSKTTVWRAMASQRLFPRGSVACDLVSWDLNITRKVGEIGVNCKHSYLWKHIFRLADSGEFCVEIVYDKLKLGPALSTEYGDEACG